MQRCGAVRCGAVENRVKVCRTPKEVNFDFAVTCIEKISAVALGVFAASVSLKLFLPFFFVGVCIGMHSYTQDTKAKNPLHSISSCAHGLLEQLTGVKLPRLVSLTANIAVTVCHIDHHSVVFVPITGVTLGAWAGKIALYYGAFMYRKIDVYLSGESFSTA